MSTGRSPFQMRNTSEGRILPEQLELALKNGV